MADAEKGLSSDAVNDKHYSLEDLMGSDHLFDKLMEMKRKELKEREEQLNKLEQAHLGGGSSEAANPKKRNAEISGKNSHSELTDTSVNLNVNLNNRVPCTQSPSVATIYGNAASLVEELNKNNVGEIVQNISDSTDYGSSDDSLNLLNVSESQLHVTQPDETMEKNNHINYLFVYLQNCVS